MTKQEKRKYWQSVIDELIEEWLKENFSKELNEEVKRKYLDQGIGFIVTHSRYRQLTYNIAADLIDDDTIKFVTWLDEVFAYIALTLINKLSSE